MVVHVPEEEHVVRVEPIDDATLLLQGQHADVQLPGVEEVEDHLDDLHLLHIDGFFRCHGDDGLAMTRAMKQNTNTTKLTKKTFRAVSMLCHAAGETKP